MILVLGGTTEGRILAKELNHYGFQCILSVLTPLGKEFALDVGVKVISGELDDNKLRELVSKEKIQIILDATHPYATQIKQIAHKIASDLQICYGRLERASTLLPEDSNLIIVQNYQQALGVLMADQGGVLLTIGIKNLSQFKPLWTEQYRQIWVKIYPELKSLETCLMHGIPPQSIIAFHGSGNREIIKGMLNLTSAEWLVTKESGAVGGTDIKITVGLEMGRKVLVIQRPMVEAKLKFGNVEEVLEFIISAGYNKS